MNRMEPTRRASSDPGTMPDNEIDAASCELKTWRGFIAKVAGKQPLRDVILASWNRSSAAGLERHGPVSFRRVTDEQLSAALAENRELLEVARPHLESISAFMCGVEHVVYLTDRHGVVLCSVGAWAHSEELRLAPGYDWSEQTMGTNGAGTAIAADRPIAVIGPEHFSTAFENCTCTGAPIHRDGHVIGAIDISTAVKDATPDRLALVAHVAFVIDRELDLLQDARQQEVYRRIADELRGRENELLRANAQLTALLDNTTAVIYLVDAEGSLLRINRRWETLFRMNNDECAGRSLFEFFPYEVAHRFVANNRQVLEARRAMEFEEEVCVDGEPRTYLTIKVPMFDSTGEPYAVCGISTDITERNAEEQRECKILREENLAKERFVAALAHELRNPISAILAAGEVLGQVVDASDAVRSATGIIVRQATHVAHLVEELLEASRISVRRFSFEKSPVDVRSVLTQAIEAVQPAIDAQKQALDVDLPAEPVTVQGDRTRLTQVFVNLLDNASRYSEPGKRISLEARSLNGEAIVRIRDDGCGMDPNTLAKIFDLLFQVRDSAGAGLGLGLSLVRGIVEAHDGVVSAHSDGPGHGSSFVVRLPLS